MKALVLASFLSLTLSLFSSCPEFVPEVTQSEGKSIYELISIIGSTSAPFLLFKMGRINELKTKVEHLPPLQFLGYIFATPALVKQMAKIRSNGAKYKPFVTGAQENLYAQYKNGCLEKQIEAFAIYLQVNPEELKKITLTAAERCVKNAQDPCFRPFFDYLIDHAQRAKK